MTQTSTASAAPPGVTPYPGLPNRQEQRASLHKKATAVTEWLEELVFALDSHIKQMTSRSILPYHIGRTPAELRNAARLPVMEQLSKRVVELISADARETHAGEVMSYLGHADDTRPIKGLLYEISPVCTYCPGVLAQNCGVLGALKCEYLEPLRRLCDQLSPVTATQPAEEAGPFVTIKVGSDSNKNSDTLVESFIEYGQNGSQARRQIRLTFKSAVILRILESAPAPGLLSANQIMTEAAKQKWIIPEVRWNRIRPALDQELAPDLKKLVGSSSCGRAFFDRTILATACRKLVS